MKFQDVDIFGTLRITGSFQVPYGYGTGSYPQNPTSGSLFLDTSDEKLYVYEGQWEVVGAQTPLPPEPYNIEYLVVAGGGGGGKADDTSGAGAGAGAGGFLSGSFLITPLTEYTVTVGAGGAAGVNFDGDESVGGNDSSVFNLTAIGGGRGGGRNEPGSGGSGGGGYRNQTPGDGTIGQGNSGGTGYDGGGGGGAGTAGSNGDGANGGNGLTSNITGTITTYAGGGGGGQGGFGGPGTGGSGGGGNGGDNAQGQAGEVNTGAGGGGGGTDDIDRAGSGWTGGQGGSGVVILRMSTSNYSGDYTGDSVTVTTSGTDTILTYTQSGTYTAS